MAETATGKVVNTAGSASGTTTLTTSYTALAMTSVTLTPQSLVVDATGELKVDFVVGTFDLTSAFTIIMTFPSRFNDEQTYFPTASSYSCRNGTSNIAVSPS